VILTLFCKASSRRGASQPQSPTVVVVASKTAKAQSKPVKPLG
jgi:hypothetical protein